MPVYRITAPDGAVFKVTAPEGTTEQDALAKIQASYQPMNVDPTAGNSFMDNTAIGFGKTFADVGLRARQLASKVGIGDAAAVQAEVDETKRRDAPIMKTAGGLAGNVAGNLAIAAPSMLIPGAGTYAGSALTGAGLAALAPTATDDSTIGNMALGAVGGTAGKFVGDKLGGVLASRLAKSTADKGMQQAQNAGRDAILTAGKSAGYVVPPSAVNPSMTSSLLEGLSGKIKTAQTASQKNQEVTNSLARKALGLADDSPLDEAILDGVRKTAGKAYEAIKSFPQKFKADQQFAQDLSALGKDFSAAAQEFPEIAKNEAITTLQTALSKPEMSPTAAIELIKKLRADSKINFRGFDDPAKLALADAQRTAANAIESLVERNLAQTGKQSLVADFRAARQLIAKAYDVDAALTKTGDVAAPILARLGQKHPLTGELKTVADFAAQFPKAMQALKEPAGPISALDVGLAFGTGNPALMAARPAARAAILSRPYQSMVAPNYTPNALLRAGAATTNNSLLRRALPALSAEGALLYAE